MFKKLFFAFSFMLFSLSSMAMNSPTLAQLENSLGETNSIRLPYGYIDSSVKEWKTKKIEFAHNVDVTYSYGYGIVYQVVVQYRNVPVDGSNKEQFSVNEKASEALKDEIVNNLQSRGYKSVIVRSMNDDSDNWMVSYGKDETYAKVQMSKLQKTNYVVTVTFDNDDINKKKKQIQIENAKSSVEERKSLL